MTAGPYDRRNGHRLHRLEEHGVIAARIRPGHDVAVVDLSTGGILVESTHRLMPGARVELHLKCHDGRVAEMVRGYVVRCSVARLGATAISYRGAIAFDQEPRPDANLNDEHADSRPGPGFPGGTSGPSRIQMTHAGYAVPRSEIEDFRSYGHTLPDGGRA